MFPGQLRRPGRDPDSHTPPDPGPGGMSSRKDRLRYRARHPQPLDGLPQSGEHVSRRQAGPRDAPPLRSAGCPPRSPRRPRGLPAGCALAEGDAGADGKGGGLSDAGAEGTRVALRGEVCRVAPVSMAPLTIQTRTCRISLPRGYRSLLQAQVVAVRIRCYLHPYEDVSAEDP